MPGPAERTIPVADYVRQQHSPTSRLAHDWELHSAILLSPAEERTMVREPAQAVPDAVAKRIGPLRILPVPYIACAPDGDVVNFSKPTGESHTSVWVDVEGVMQIVLACRELDAHDTGFEFLACLAELLRPQFTEGELAEFDRLLEAELREQVPGEIDEEALRAKRAFRGRTVRRSHGDEFARYRDVSLVETLAEYMHGLWHDVQIRVGPDHLPLPQLRLRMELLARLFPPNAGYRVFDEGMDKGVEASEPGEPGTPE